MAGAVEPVEGEDTDAVLFRQLFDVLFPEVRLLDLHDLVVVIGEVGHAHDADVLHVVGHPSGVGDHRHVDALDRLLDDVLVTAELGAGEHLHGQLAAGSLGHALREGVKALAERMGIGELSGHHELVGFSVPLHLRGHGHGAGSDERKTYQQEQRFLHVSFLPECINYGPGGR